MPLVPGICPQCRGLLEVDMSKDAAVCPYCHTPFIIEKAINNYNTTNITQIENLQTDTVVLNDTTSIENRVHAGVTFIQLGNFQMALETFQKLAQECPYDYRSWWGLIRVKTQEFTSYMSHSSDFNELCELYEHVKRTAEHESLIKIEALFDEYKRCWNKHYNDLTEEKALELAQCKKEYKQEHRELEADIEDLNIEEEKTDDNYYRASLIITVFGGVLLLGLLLHRLIETSKVGDFLLSVLIYGGIIGLAWYLILKGLERLCRLKLEEIREEQSELDFQIEQLEINFENKKDEIEDKYKWL